MNWFWRHLIGMAVIAMVAIVLFWGMTEFGRSRLQLALDEQDSLINREAKLTAKIVELGKSSQSVAMPKQLIWPGADSAVVEVAVQQALVAAASQEALQLVSFGAAPPQNDLNHASFAYEIEVEGGHAEVARFIAAIEAITPRLAISDVWMRQMPVMEGQSIAPISARLGVWGFREGEPTEQ